MADVDNRGSGSGNTAIVAIVVLILIAVLAYFVLYNPPSSNNTGEPDVNVEVTPPGSGGDTGGNGQ